MSAKLFWCVELGIISKQIGYAWKLKAASHMLHLCQGSDPSSGWVQLLGSCEMAWHVWSCSAPGQGSYLLTTIISLSKNCPEYYVLFFGPHGSNSFRNGLMFYSRCIIYFFYSDAKSLSSIGQSARNLAQWSDLKVKKGKVSHVPAGA